MTTAEIFMFDTGHFTNPRIYPSLRVQSGLDLPQKICSENVYLINNFQLVLRFYRLKPLFLLDFPKTRDILSLFLFNGLKGNEIKKLSRNKPKIK